MSLLPRGETKGFRLLPTGFTLIVDDFNKFIESPEVLALIAQLKPPTRSADLLNNLDSLIGLSDNLKKLQEMGQFLLYKK